MSDFLLFTISIGITLLGLLGSWRVYRRRGAASGMRGAAWSLAPTAAYLTGLTSWAADLVFSPVKWAGMAILGLAAVLYVVSGVMLRRDTGPAADAGRPASGRSAASGPEGSARGGAEPAAGPEKAPRKASRKAIEKRQAPQVDPDLAEIEDILRRRGIS